MASDEEDIRVITEPWDVFRPSVMWAGRSFRTHRSWKVNERGGDTMMNSRQIRCSPPVLTLLLIVLFWPT